MSIVERWIDHPRIDAREKVTGEARYIEDLPDLPSMAYGATLRSPFSHARILSIDSSRAERLPGVLGIIDRDHLDGLNPMLTAPKHPLFNLSDDQPFIATDKVRFDGELVAEVVAEDLRTACQAVELIKVDYQPLAPIFIASEALDPNAPVLHEKKGSNLLLEDKLEWGNLELGFKEADRIFEESYTSPSMFHHPIENVGGCIATFLNNEIDIWAATSSPFRNTHSIAKFFGIDPDQVRVRVPTIGGGFGSKGITNSILAALFLSRKVTRPIKLVPSVDESFRQTGRHAMTCNVKLGIKSDGTLTALDVDLVVDTGAYTTGAAFCTHNAVVSAWGCYRVPNLQVQARCAYTNKVPAGHTRATGKVQTTWAIECAMDNAAHQMGIDPIEFRKRNVLRRGEFVAEGTPPMDTDYLELIRRAVSAIHWDGQRYRHNELSQSNKRLSKGKGISLSLRQGVQGGDKTQALAIMNCQNIVQIQHNAPDLGQGIHNMISIIASRALGIPQTQIQVGRPDTAVNLSFGGVNSQRTTMQMGKAVENACENLKRELVLIACSAKGGCPEEWQIFDGRLWRAENSFSFGEIVGTRGGNSSLECRGIYTPPLAQKGSVFRGMDHWAPSAAAAEVEVDQETGEFRVLRYSVVADVGKAIHYQSAKAQVDGGAVMGFGHALLEEVIYSDGHLQNADSFQYRLPVMTDIPEWFHSSMLENGDGPGPFGSKAMSQTSIVTVAPVIGNAIYDAIGVRIRSLPITPEKILRGLGKL